MGHPVGVLGHSFHRPCTCPIARTHGQERPLALRPSFAPPSAFRALHSLGSGFPDRAFAPEAPDTRQPSKDATPGPIHHNGIRAAYPMHKQVQTTTSMLRWVLTFLIIAIVAGIFGFGGIAAGAAEIAKIIFFIFIVLLLLSLIFGRSIWKQS